MISFEELNQQNHKISELSQITMHLVRDRSLCDMDTTCDIFLMFVDAVNNHLKYEETGMYSALLTHSDNKVTQAGNKFMIGSAEIKKIFQDYTNKWCNNKKLRIKNHDNFIADTESMMNIVSKRVQDETEKLFPLVREVIKEVA